MRKRLAFLLALMAGIRTLFNTAYRMAYPFLGVFARALGVPLGDMAWVMSARSLIGAALAPFISRLADTHGRRIGMLTGLLVFVGSMGLVVFWPSFYTLAAALIFGTVAKYIFDPAMQAYLGDRVAYNRRGLALSITEMGWSLAFILGIPLAGFLIARYGWMAPFPLLALSGLAGALALWLSLADDRPDIQPATRRDGFQAVWASKIALAGLAVGLLASSANEVVNLLFGVWLEDSFGLKIAALGGAAFVIGASELGGEGLVALLSDLLGKKRAVALGLVGNLISAFLLYFLGHSIAGALIGLFLFYITFEFTLVASIPLMTELLPQARATLMAFNVTALSLGRAIGAPIGTWLYQFGFFFVILGAAALNLLALLALGFVHEK